MEPFVSLEHEEACLKNALRPLLTPEWLTTLVHAVRVGGFSDIDDIYEVAKFAEWCHAMAGVPCPELYTCYMSAFAQDPPLPPAPV